MRITNKKLSKKQILVTTLAVAVAICGSVFALDKIGVISIFPKETVPNISKEPTPQEKKSEKKTNQDTKESFLNAIKDDKEKSVEKSKPAPVPKSNSSIELSANRDGDSVTIIIKLKEQGYSQGKCSLTVAANGKRVAQNADIIYQPEYSTCAGFSIPVSSVGSGQWAISLSVTPLNGNPITKTLTKEI